MTFIRKKTAVCKKNVTKKKERNNFSFFSYQPKTIFYRALQDNPSAKALGLDLIYYCADHESSSSAPSGTGAAAGNALAVQSDVQDIFTEKEVRIRMPIEELKLLLEDEEEEGAESPPETESNNMD